MEHLIEYRSDNLGLWPRFLTKLIAAWITAFSVSWLFSFMIPSTVRPYIFWPLFLLVTVAYTWRLINDNPLRWRHSVIFDLQNKMIRILKHRQDRLGSGLLDCEGEQIPFQEIDYYTVQYYESFLFSGYYLVKIYVKGQEVKLVSFKNADDLNEMIDIFKHRLT